MSSVTTDGTGGALDRRQSAADRVARCLQRMADVDRPEAWITVRDRHDLLADAARIDAAVEAGERLPLAGLVFAIKDNIDLAGVPTTAASPAFSYLPKESAEAVQRLVDAGAIPIGKTNLDQFATGLVGTRSPYGVVRNAWRPELVSGGSSSGSAVVTALGVVDFALGTDTAGSGRVPPAFNGLIGVKPTLGIIPNTGVVPAAPSYDCVTSMAATLRLATEVIAIMAGTGEDPRSRDWPSDVRLAAPAVPLIALPDVASLDLLSDAAIAAFTAQVERLEAMGARFTTIDVTPMLECAHLLYGGALVAERYFSFGPEVETDDPGVDPTVARIVREARTVTGAAVIRDQQRVVQFRRAALASLGDADALLLPTAPSHPSIAEVLASPIETNSRLGTFTNFVNLLGFSAVSVPAGEVDDGLFGVTVIAREFDDQVAIDIAALLTGEAAPLLPGNGIPVVLFGAHMSGLPLNPQVQALGARYIGPALTAPRYRMVALPGEPARPGVHRVDKGGAALPGEVWMLSPAGLGRFLAALPAPMTLGKVELDDGRLVVGFGCSAPAGPDITHHGGWRSYLASTTQGAPQ